jgi:hypothetical protein
MFFFMAICPGNLDFCGSACAYNGSSAAAQGCAGKAQAFDLSFPALLPYILPENEDTPNP